jgi:HNH endonuclease
MFMHDWHVIHEEVVALGKSRAQHEHLLGRALLRAYRALIWEPLGMASFAEYAEHYLGLTPRQAEERLRVATALESLPRLDRALASGERHFSAVRELTRVATAETEAEWMERSRDMTVGDIEKLVAGREPGDRPDDPQGPRRHRLVLDLSAETYALFREAQAKIRRDSDDALTDDDSISLMARQVLGGPGDDGRSPYQIHMTLCARCGRAEQEGRGQSIPVVVEAAEQATCDAQRVDAAGHAAQDIPPATRRLVMARHHRRCAAPGCRNATFTDVHHIIPRAEGGTHDPELLIVLCSAHHRAIHSWTLRVAGTWSTGYRFFHADGSPYGSAAKAENTALLGDVHKALRGLQFTERQTRAAIDHVRPHVGAHATFADVFRMAMAVTRSAAVGGF